jgi:histidine ammonia-lyase
MPHIPAKKLTLEDFIKICEPDSQLSFPESSQKVVRKGQEAVASLMEKRKVVYGVNTGVGDLCDCVLDGDDLYDLQENIILSHACGSAPYLDEDVSRGALFLVINSRSKGYSGVGADVLKKLTTLFNNNVSPMLPAQGSLGASGDLIPLAHLAMSLLHRGDLCQMGKIRPAVEVMKGLKIPKHEFLPKEALSLINGTEVSTSSAAFVLAGALDLFRSSMRSVAAFFEISGASTSSIDPDLHLLKPHNGQVETAAMLRSNLSDSKLCNRHGKVQDSYTIRCTPQIDGAVLDRLQDGARVVETEMNSVTDNPLFFVGDDGVKSVCGGNFHAQNIAFTMDMTAIALTTFGKIHERRIERLMNSSLSGLPAFLAHNGGLNSGLMVSHYLVAALCAENSVLAHPASIQSVPVSANQEDFVSMSMTAANKAGQILHNCQRIMAVEILAVAQAMDMMMKKNNIPLSSFGSSARDLHQAVRSIIPYLDKDRWLGGEIDAVTELVKKGYFANREIK